MFKFLNLFQNNSIFLFIFQIYNLLIIIIQKIEQQAFFYFFLS
jgi:hypothetical protein